MKLIPRFTVAQAEARLLEITERLRAGESPLAMVQTDPAGAVPNATGGEVATPDDLVRWRRDVSNFVGQVRPGTRHEKDRQGILLGEAIETVIQPGASDAASDGIWSFLSLVMFPDLVHARWPADAAGVLAADRWIGRQSGRDRNYLKLSWRRWLVLGPVLKAHESMLGEDEYGALLERSALARNVRLVRAAAEVILSYDEGSRTEFARSLMKRITYQTGPRSLDILGDGEIRSLVRRCSSEVLRDGVPRRAIEPRG